MKILGVHLGYRNQNTVLLLLCLLLAAWWIFLTVNRPPPAEGFEQSDRFLVRRAGDVYDEFLAQIYDRIYRPQPLNAAIFDAVERLTEPDHEKSVMLDAGCGTGTLLQYMQSKGYLHSYGVDQSSEMVEFVGCATDTDVGALKVKEGDLALPMTYDKHTFSHIFMTGNTVYHFQDKVQLFRNIYYWLMPHGHFILEVYDRERFDTVPATGKPLLVSDLQSLVAERITVTEIDFADFVYESRYDFSRAATDRAVMFQETFTDAATRHVRQNEMILYMEPLQDVVYMAQYAGFLVHGQFKTKDDPHKYVFILQRPH